MSPLARWITGRRWVIRTISRTHVAVYRASGGRVGGSFRGMGFLLLHTTGARTGRRRTTPLLFMPDGDALVVVGSNGGSLRHPAWLHNVRATPGVEVTVGRTTRQVRARVADPAEKARLWPLLNRLYPYDDYQRHTTREIAVVLLEPPA